MTKKILRAFKLIFIGFFIFLVLALLSPTTSYAQEEEYTVGGKDVLDISPARQPSGNSSIWR